MKGAGQSVHAHDVAASFHTLVGEVPGLACYNWRALVQRGTHVVGNHPCLDDYRRYLKSVGIGDENGCVPVASDRIYDELRTDAAARRSVEERLAVGATFRPFAINPVDDQFLADTGWRRHSVFAPTLSVSQMANDKAFLRQMIASTLQRPDLVPAFRVVNTPDQLAAAVEWAFKQPHDFVVVKVPRLASGAGMHFATRPADAFAFGSSLITDGYTDVVVELGYHSVSCSMQYELRGPGQLRFIGGSLQIVSDHGRVHEGNVISADGDLPGLSRVDIAHAQKLFRPVVEWFAANGYVGILGYDFIKTHEPTPRFFMIETNGRTTAATYPFAVGRQLDDRSHHHWGIAMRNVYPAGVADFSALCRRLGSDLFNGRRGILPMIPNALPGKACCLAVAENAPAASELLEDWERKLDGGDAAA